MRGDPGNVAHLAQEASLLGVLLQVAKTGQSTRIAQLAKGFGGVGADIGVGVAQQADEAIHHGRIATGRGAQGAGSAPTDAGVIIIEGREEDLHYLGTVQDAEGIDRVPANVAVGVAHGGGQGLGGATTTQASQSVGRSAADPFIGVGEQLYERPNGAPALGIGQRGSHAPANARACIASAGNQGYHAALALDASQGFGCQGAYGDDRVGDEDDLEGVAGLGSGKGGQGLGGALADGGAGIAEPDDEGFGSLIAADAAQHFGSMTPHVGIAVLEGQQKGGHRRASDAGQSLGGAPAVLGIGGTQPGHQRFQGGIGHQGLGG